MTHRNRIDGFHSWALLLVAGVVDFLQFFLGFIPFVGPLLSMVIAIVARIVFWLWFKLLDVGFMDTSKRYIANVAMTLGEMFPLVNMIPIWTVGTAIIIHGVHSEDREYNEKQKEKAAR